MIIGSGFITFSGLLAVESQIIFWAAISLKLAKGLFAGAIAFPTYYTLYQPLSLECRTLIQTSSETIVGPVLGMFAGAILLLLVKHFHLASTRVSIVLLLIALG